MALTQVAASGESKHDLIYAINQSSVCTCVSAFALQNFSESIARTNMTVGAIECFKEDGDITITS